MDTHRDWDNSDLLALWAESRQGSKSNDAVQRFVESLIDWSDFTSDRYGAATIAHLYYTRAISLNDFLRDLTALSDE